MGRVNTDTAPVPADRDQPVAPARSDLAALALACGVDRSDVQAFVSASSRGGFTFARPGLEFDDFPLCG